MIATSFSNLSREIDIAEGSTVSKTLYQDATIKMVLFGFAAGQELSEHTAAVPAVLHFLDGKAEVTLGGERMVAEAQSLVHMPAQLPHSITALEPTRMLLLLIKQPAGA